jgi:putative tributyrin esterase
MAHLRCDFFSEVLRLSISMTVILPQQTSSQIGMAGSARGGAHPTLYLLHGLSDDDTIWLRRTSIERYVAPLGLAVVMPQVHRSFYTDEAHGNRYWTFLSAELPALAGEFFRLSQRREDTFVAGLSMGGYGAFKWALRQPDRFAAAASLSGALDMARRGEPGRRNADPEVVDRVFGNRTVAGTGDDLFWLLHQADRSSTSLPASLYVLRHGGRAVPGEPDVPRCLSRQEHRSDRRLRSGAARMGLLGRQDPGRPGLAADCATSELAR